MKNATLFYGQNPVFIREAVEKLLQKVETENLTSFYAAEHSVGEMISECEQSSLFGGGQTVLIRDVQEMKPSDKTEFQKRLIAYLQDYHTENSLIITWEIESGKKMPKKVLSAFESSPNFSAIEFKRAYRRDLEHYARERLMSEGLTFDESAVDLLIQLSGDDVSAVSMMCGLLLDYSRDKGRVTVEDARHVLSRAHNLSTFDLIDGLFLRSAARAFSALSDLRLDKNEHILKINAVLLSTARKFWEFLSTGSGAYGYQAKKFLEYKKQSNLRFVSGVIELCGKVDFSVKSLPEDFAYLEVEKFIAENCR